MTPMLIVPIMYPLNWTEVFVFPLLERVMCERGIPNVFRVIIKVLTAIVFLPLLTVYFLVLGILIGFAIFMIKIDGFNTK
jgi:hypothetical protein